MGLKTTSPKTADGPALQAGSAEQQGRMKEQAHEPLVEGPEYDRHDGSVAEGNTPAVSAPGQ